MEPCAVHQDVPEYAWLIAQGQYDRALDVILARNPLPGVTGYVCTHLCQTRCTRNDYDQPVAIRLLKRFAAEKGTATTQSFDKLTMNFLPNHLSVPSIASIRIAVPQPRFDWLTVPPSAPERDLHVGCRFAVREGEAPAEPFLRKTATAE